MSLAFRVRWWPQLRKGWVMLGIEDLDPLLPKVGRCGKTGVLPHTPCHCLPQWLLPLPVCTPVFSSRSCSCWTWLHRFGMLGESRKEVANTAFQMLFLRVWALLRPMCSIFRNVTKWEVYSGVLSAVRDTVLLPVTLTLKPIAIHSHAHAHTRMT